MTFSTSAKRFLRSTRAGATAITAAAVTIATVGGAALLMDQVWLVDQRDALKSASTAAATAATLAMRRRVASDPTISDDDLKAALEPVARRYVLMNFQHLSSERYDAMLASLGVEVLPNKNLGTVDVDVQADLGGSIFSAMFASGGGSASSGMTRAASRVENTIIPAEVVLSIDISGSMNQRLDPDSSAPRVDIVKRAARDMVAILNPNAENRKALGVVPWGVMVQLDHDSAENWVRNGWTEYPRSRRYPYTYRCSPRSNCVSGDEVQALPAVADLSLSGDSVWFGCLDEHRVEPGGVADLTAVSELFDHPSYKAFAQGYFPALEGAAYECLQPPLPSDFSGQRCYDRDFRHRGAREPGVDFRRPQDHFCPPPVDFNVVSTSPLVVEAGDRLEIPAILPLTTDRGKIENTIDSLAPYSGETYSALGILWAQRLLSHSWSSVWGGGEYPLDPDADGNEGARKAVVLLTDGEDTVDLTRIQRGTACTAAKEEGTEIFVVAAIPPEFMTEALAADLEACSSAADDPEGRYVFLENYDEATLRAAFASIAAQLTTTRRVY